MEFKNHLHGSGGGSRASSQRTDPEASAAVMSWLLPGTLCYKYCPGLTGYRSHASPEQIGQ